MTCETARALLHPYVDGELDLHESAEVESHLESCAACRAQFEAERALRGAVGRGASYFRAPAALEACLTRHCGRVLKIRRSPVGSLSKEFLCL